MLKVIVLLGIAWVSLSIGLALGLGPVLKKGRLEQTTVKEEGEQG